MAGKRKGASKTKPPKRAKSDKDNEDVDPTVEEEDNDDDEQYVVEAVVDKRKRSGKVEYQIKWQGYDDQDNTWERMNIVQLFYSVYFLHI